MWAEPTYRSRGLFSFSRKEMHDILISIAVLTISFGIAFSGGAGKAMQDPYFFMVYTLPVAFLSVFTAFFLHEMGHRIMARKYGCWSEFRMWEKGLLLAFVTALLGFVFAAPGAVYISGMISRKQNGIISAAGPMTNALIAFSMMALAIFTTPFVAGIALFVAWINIFLAGFNLIPFPPLDGYKVFRWGIIPYLGMVALIIALYVALGYMRILFL